MNLDEPQRNKICAWIGEGLKLSEIQDRLALEFGLRLTYVEVRLLVDDLKLVPKDPEPSKAVQPLVSPPAAGVSTPAAATPAAKPIEAPRSAGGVSVTVDQLARPGAIVSGKVTFSDGQKAEWYLDQNGRLGIVPKQPGYKPPAGDVQQFQLILEGELAKLGFG